MVLEHPNPPLVVVALVVVAAVHPAPGRFHYGLAHNIDYVVAMHDYIVVVVDSYDFPTIDRFKLLIDFVDLLTLKAESYRKLSLIIAYLIIHLSVMIWRPIV